MARVQTSPIKSLITSALGPVSIEVRLEGEPEGRRLGRINIPGAVRYFLIIRVRVLGFDVVYGYVEIV